MSLRVIETLADNSSILDDHGAEGLGSMGVKGQA
jgi:hypothetical protein